MKPSEQIADQNSPVAEAMQWQQVLDLASGGSLSLAQATRERAPLMEVVP